MKKSIQILKEGEHVVFWKLIDVKDKLSNISSEHSMYDYLTKLKEEYENQIEEIKNSIKLLETWNKI